MEAQLHTYDLHIHLFPADDLPGIWMAHCLDFDLLGHGHTIPEALAVLREVVEDVLVDELRQGKDPSRRRAPKEDWDELWTKIVPGSVAQPFGLVMEHQGEVKHVVTFPCVVVSHFESPAPTFGTSSFELPPFVLAEDLRRRSA